MDAERGTGSTRGMSAVLEICLEIELRRDSGRGNTCFDGDAGGGEAIIDSGTVGPWAWVMIIAGL